MEREILMGVWLRGGGEKNVVGPVCFLLKTNKIFSPQNIEKTEGESLICLIDKNTHMHLDFVQLSFLFLFLSFCFPRQRWLFFYFIFFFCFSRRSPPPSPFFFSGPWA